MIYDMTLLHVLSGLEQTLISDYLNQATKRAVE